jgi:hypothetical protein
MLTLHHSNEIDRPRDVIWDVLAVPEKELEFDPAGPIRMEKLTDGPVREGTRYRGRWHRYGMLEWSYGEFERPRVVVHDATTSLGHMVHRLTLEEVGHGSRFVQRLEFDGKAWTRPLTPLLKVVLRRRMEHLGRVLKRYMEDSPLPTAEASASERA